MADEPVVVREVLTTIPYGSRDLQVCDTRLTLVGEHVAEIVDYTSTPAPGRDPYGAGAIIPLSAVDDVIAALREFKRRHQASRRRP